MKVNNMHIIKSSIFLLVSLIFSHADQYTVKPSVVEHNGKLVISFKIAYPTDVEIAIIDIKGKIVRHLAAGVIGGDKLPPQPLLPSLSQTIEWDGLDDYGNAILSGPFSARIRLGVTPQFEKRISTRGVFSSAKARYWFDTTGIYPNTFGLDSTISVDTFLPSTHPVFRSRYDGGSGSMYEAYIPLDMTVSKADDKILLQTYSYLAAPSTLIDGISGNTIKKWTITLSTMYPIPPGGECDKFSYFRGEPVFDWHGRFILHDGGGACTYVYRFTPEGTPLPFVTGSHGLLQSSATTGDLRQRGLCSDAEGNIYQARALSSTFFSTSAKDRYYVSKFDSNGTLITDSLLRIWGNIGQGIRIDLKGNIFAGIRVKPFPDTVPSFMRSRLSGSFTEAKSQADWARILYGSIVKFGPEGGAIYPDASGPLMAGPAFNRSNSDGILWMHYSASMQPTHADYLGSGCICYAPRFDVDAYGRVFFTNGFENEFQSLDNNGNMIFRAHNRDFLDQVRIGLFHSIQVTDRAMYCADYINSQIVCFTWKADAETLLSIPGSRLEHAVSIHQAGGLSNSPNPFNPVTTIRIALGEPAASLHILDIKGKRVADLSPELLSGKTVIDWKAMDLSGKRVASGFYILRLTTASNKVMTRVITLMD